MPWQRVEPGGGLVDHIEGPAGVLEVRVDAPRGAPRGLAVVGHPHPLYGGTMDNKVVYTLARTAVASGLLTVRFNFRGVGASTGPHAHGEGETDDADFICAQLQAQYPELPLFLLGFSFGSYIMLSVAARRAVAGLVTIAPPLFYAGNGPVPQPQAPWLLVHGDADDVVDCNDTLTRARDLEPGPDIQIMPGAGHFFHNALGDLRARVSNWLEPLVPHPQHD